MNKFLSFILIFVFLGVSPSVRAAPTCAAVFNRSEVQKALDKLPYVSIHESHYNNRNATKAKNIIESLIDKKMLNDPDLAYTVLLYLIAVKQSLSMDVWNEIVKKMAEDLQILKLVESGKRIYFSNLDINDVVNKAETNKSNFFNLAQIPSRQLFNLFLNMLRPSDIENIDSIATDLSKKIDYIALITIPPNRAIRLLPHIPQYNRFKILKTILKQHLKVSEENYQEIFIINNGKKLKNVIVMSSQKIAGHDAYIYGISLKHLETIAAHENFENKHYSWIIEGEKYSADISYKNHGEAHLEIPLDRSPDYKQMLKDKKLTGVIAVVNNLSEHAKILTQSYLDYFKTEKFKLAEAKKISSDEAHSLILNLAHKGEIDYFLREGHGESAAESMISFNEKNSIFKLVRSRKDFIEEVYFIAPEETKENIGRTLSFSEFGQALRTRTAQGQLLYFDSSCVGHCGTHDDFQAVAAKGFIPMGSTEMLGTFTGQSKSAVYEFLNGVRNQFSYPEMTKNIKKDENLITPDDPRYEASRNGNHRVPVIELTIQRNFPHK